MPAAFCVIGRMLRAASPARGPAGKREKIRAAGPGGRFFKEKVEKESPISWIICIFTLYEALRDYLFVSLLVDAPAGSAEQSLRD